MENDIKQKLISLQQEKDNLKKEINEVNNTKTTIMVNDFFNDILKMSMDVVKL